MRRNREHPSACTLMDFQGFEMHPHLWKRKRRTGNGGVQSVEVVKVDEDSMI